MLNKKANQDESSERLDQLGSRLVRAAASNEPEAEAVSASPFLYARLRSRINAERARREEGENWLALLRVIWRTAPSMALIAVFAFILFLASLPGTTPAPRNFSEDALLDARNTEVERVVFAERNLLSNDEVLASIMDDEEEASR